MNRKREYRREKRVREYEAKQRRREERIKERYCFWTWPWGHDFEGRWGSQPKFEWLGRFCRWCEKSQ